ncbi:MAG: Rrf2 family transcriptional regulator [Desulfuromonadaceae bacterium]|nr:Rrf2 family transcriptional regulator [Desulfuromonadaceae bacterium]MDD2847553.1 Rrf2 family transcriptional regulator [Desulfuromonadaceae bacterium]MDD4132233.1 Rrf2 family transcriptional regulator [Desulfuromonadaceae bacterium]
MLSKKTKYALKALINLAGQPPDEPVLISELARLEQIPRKFLEAILLSLKNAGLLQSKIGKGGGYFLAREPRNISIGSIIKVLEGGYAPVQCLNASNNPGCDECNDFSTCGIRLVMTDVMQAISSVLETTTLADMVERSDNAKQANANVVDFNI